MIEEHDSKLREESSTHEDEVERLNFDL